MMLMVDDDVNDYNGVNDW